MKKPCDNCPFRADRPFRGLSPGRAREIAKSLMGDGDFPCHKTVDYSGGDGEGRTVESSTRCVGAAIFLENVRPGGMLANVQFRLAAMFGRLRPEELSAEIPVYQSISDFIKGASGSTR